MSEYQQRISQLLESCQNEWVSLEAMMKEKEVNPATHLASKQLRDGIKQLVQLQDNLDETGLSLEKNTQWTTKAEELMRNVSHTLELATEAAPKINPISSQSSPLISSKQQYSKSLCSMNNDIQEEVEEEDEEDEQFLDASEELPQQMLTMEPSEDIPVPSSSSSSVTKDSLGKPFGRRSIIVGVEEPLSNREEKKKTKSIFPLLKGLRSSQSTPIRKNNTSEPAQINFYKDDDRTSTDAKHFIFATDAIVDHPLRIGVGYGSYICYSCTILSDKGAPITVRKRYSDFVELREELIKQYPTLKRSIPKLPPKKVVGKFTPTFVEQRRRELEYFFKFVVLHPVVGASPIVRHWIAP
ncbi:hypothetical protein INT47_003168 [Mucor saturninus]|uniref:Endosomal/vacuolar adapter protein YPT35 n=1 Tax=Mucor saturninus TaxID=64648 RepID=A0A8H7V2H1_9FUNG|nr:hypothetical protein INT47_003168 [Mucor saturninus]